jgi:hypothetical protein
MPAFQPTKFRYARAIFTFFAAYVIVTFLAVALSVGAEAAMHNPPTSDVVHSSSYLFAYWFGPPSAGFILNFAAALRFLPGKLWPWVPSGSFSQFLWTTSASSS